MDAFLGKEPEPRPYAKLDSDVIVRLVQPLPRPAVTPVEALAVSALEQGALALDILVDQVASELYLEELRNGAWVLDIGLLGKRLFVPDVVREIAAAKKVLWQMEKRTAATA